MSAVKVALRKQIKSILQTIPETSIIEQSQHVLHHLQHLSSYREARRVSVYIHKTSGAEVRTDGIIRDILSDPCIHRLFSLCSYKPVFT